MSPKRKRRMFELLVQIGYKEVEVGFPSASQTDYNFMREIIEKNMIPNGVTIQALIQVREHLIRRALGACAGAKNVIIRFYNSTSILQRDVVFRKDKDAIKKIATDTMELIKTIVKGYPGTGWRWEYSPESYTDTEAEYAKEVVGAVIDVIGPTPENPIIISLLSTIGMITPSVCADSIEWVHRNFDRRDSIILSLCPHNDRGIGIAAAKLGYMTGAGRIGGCLFDNGERTDNVCLVTLDLNMPTQGVDPQIGSPDIDLIRRTVEYCNQLRIPERHPCGGDLAFTASSDSHQDVMNRGPDAMADEVRPSAAIKELSDEDLHTATWEVPYLPIGPRGVGRSYEAVIRVNSQPGKDGVTHIVKMDHSMSLPRSMQVKFSSVVRAITDAEGGGVNSKTIWDIFADECPDREAPLEQIALTVDAAQNESGAAEIKTHVIYEGKEQIVEGVGNGPLTAYTNTPEKLGISVEVRGYVQHTHTAGDDAEAAAYILADINDIKVWGSGITGSITCASLKAVISAVNRALT